MYGWAGRFIHSCAVRDVCAVLCCAVRLTISFGTTITNGDGQCWGLTASPRRERAPRGQRARLGRPESQTGDARDEQVCDIALSLETSKFVTLGRHICDILKNEKTRLSHDTPSSVPVGHPHPCLAPWGILGPLRAIDLAPHLARGRAVYNETRAKQEPCHIRRP